MAHGEGLAGGIEGEAHLEQQLLHHIQGQEAIRLPADESLHVTVVTELHADELVVAWAALPLVGCLPLGEGAKPRL